MISEGSCDIEDWSNGCSKFNFAITGINFKIYKIIKQLFDIVILSPNITVYNCNFDQINAALVSIKKLLSKTL